MLLWAKATAHRFGLDLHARGLDGRDVVEERGIDLVVDVLEALTADREIRASDFAMWHARIEDLRGDLGANDLRQRFAQRLAQLGVHAHDATGGVHAGVEGFAVLQHDRHGARLDGPANLRHHRRQGRGDGLCARSPRDPRDRLLEAVALCLHLARRHGDAIDVVLGRVAQGPLKPIAGPCFRSSAGIGWSSFGTCTSWMNIVRVPSRLVRMSKRTRAIGLS